MKEYWCYYPHRLSNSVSPVYRILKIVSQFEFLSITTIWVFWWKKFFCDFFSPFFVCEKNVFFCESFSVKQFFLSPLSLMSLLSLLLQLSLLSLPLLLSHRSRSQQTPENGFYPRYKKCYRVLKVLKDIQGQQLMVQMKGLDM